LDTDTADYIAALPPAVNRAQAFTLWLRSRDFRQSRDRAVAYVERVLSDNPHSTLQVVLDPLDNPQSLTAATLEALTRACFRELSYLDRFYSLLPGRPQGAKRLVVFADAQARRRLGTDWGHQIGEFAALVWRGADQTSYELEEHEYVVT
jgi:hypothetical protein